MSENNNLIRCECGKEFRGNFCPICGRRAVKVEQIQQPIPQPVQRPAQQSTAQGYAQQTSQQTMPQQPVQRPAQQSTAQGYAQQTPQQTMPQQPVQRPAQQSTAQGYAQQTPQQTMPQQPVQRPAHQSTAQGYAQQTPQRPIPQQPVQRLVQQPTAQGYAQQTPQQTIVQAYQYQGQQNEKTSNNSKSSKFDFMTVWNFFLEYRISVFAPIAALIAFASGYILTGLSAIVFGIYSLPQVRAKFVGKKVLYYIIWTVCLLVLILCVEIDTSQEYEDDYDYNYNDYSYADTNGMYFIGDVVDCGDWYIRVDSVEVNDLIKGMVTCTVTVENASGYDKKFVSSELFVLDNNGVSDTAMSMDDANIVASGSVFTTELMFYFSEYANKDVNSMTLNAGGNTVYLY